MLGRLHGSRPLSIHERGRRAHSVPSALARVCVLVATALGTASASAQDAPIAPPEPSVPAEPTEADPAGEDAIETEPVDEDDVVEARTSRTVGVRAPPSRATSDFVLDVNAYRIVPRRTAEQLLTLAPGVVLANHGGIGHASTLYLRGFDAGEGQDVAYEVDGVILNEHSNPHGHGYADPSFVPVESIQRVLVREGPFDPRQPSYSIAGSIRYDLGIAERGLRFGLRYGSFRTVRALITYAPTGERDGTFVAADAVRGDGFGPNRAHESVRLLARYERVSNDVTWSVFGASHAQRFDSAGVVPQAAYFARTLPCATGRDAQFFCPVDPNQGGSAQRHLMLGRVAIDKPGWTFENVAYAMLRDDRFRDDFTGIAQSPLGDGLDQSYRATTLAIRGSYRLRGRFLDAAQTFELGYLGRHDQGRSSMNRVRFSDGIPRAQVFDSLIRTSEIAAYGLYDLTLSRYLTAQGGVRLEGFAAGITHLGLPTSDRDGPRLDSQRVDSFGLAFAPRAVFLLHPHESLDIVLSAGRGTRPVDAQGLSSGEQLPFTRVGAYELGAAHRLFAGSVSLTSRASLFATRVTNDLVFDASSGRNVPIGETRRYGAMLTSALAWSDRLNAQGAFTWAEAHEATSGSSPFALASGPRVPFVPRFVGRVDVAYHDDVAIRRQHVRLSAGAGLTVIGRKPLPFGELSHRIAVVDAAVEARYRWVAVELLCENVLDARYRSYELQALSDFSPVDGSTGGTMRSSRLFAAGAPRTLFMTLSVFLDPTHFTATDE